jgi:DNA-binding MarR family transcriptional regulator
MSHIMNEQLRRLTLALRPLEISGPIWRVLSELDDYGPANISDLARRSALERSNVSRIVDRLIEAGFVESADHADKRVHLVQLSRLGRAKYQAAARVVAPLNQATISVFSPDELDQLNRLLNRLAIVFGADRD